MSFIKEATKVSLREDLRDVRNTLSTPGRPRLWAAAGLTAIAIGFGVTAERIYASSETNSDRAGLVDAAEAAVADVVAFGGLLLTVAGVVEKDMREETSRS